MSDVPTLIPLRPPPLPLGSPSLKPPAPAVVPHFVAGIENRLASFVCLSDDSIVSRGNPLLLIGPSGTGKSTIARHLSEIEAARFHQPTIISEPAVDFARRYAEAVDTDRIDAFRARYHTNSVLVIEDLQLIAGKVAAQNELSARLSNRIDGDLPTIVTCRRLPTDVPGLRSHLASRLLPGLTIQLRPPGREARKKILSDYATRRELSLTGHQIDLLEQHVPADIPAPALCAALQQLVLASRAANATTLSDDEIRAITTTVTSESEPSLAAIAKVVARHHKLKLADLKSASRRKQVVRARSMAMFLGRRLTSQSLQVIGRYFGGRDHSTVIHAIRSSEDALTSDSSFALATEDVAEKLGCPLVVCG